MASTFTPSFRLDKQAIGENKSTWGTYANRNLDLIETAIVGHVDVPIANVNTDLPGTNGNTDIPRNFMLNFTGTLTADRTVTVPNVTKTYIIRNSTTGTPAPFNIIFKTLGGTTAAHQVTLRGGEQRFVFFDTAKNAWTNENWVDFSSATRRFDITPRVELDGSMEVGKYIDFHNTDADATDWAMRLTTVNASSANSTTGLYIVNGGALQPTAGLIWHSNNDGPNTGLNADLLDNFHAADLTFAVGTRMLFLQAAAPTGWTRDTDVNLNNRALRVITSGVAGSGGTLDFTVAFAAGRTTSGGDVGSTILTTAMMPNHQHTIDADGRSGTESAHTHPAGGLATGVNSVDHYHNMFAGGNGDTDIAVGTYATLSRANLGDWNYTIARDTTSPVAPTVGKTSINSNDHTHDVTGSTGAGTSHYHAIPANTGFIGSSGGHDHPFTNPTIGMDVKYVDAIIGVKA